MLGFNDIIGHEEIIRHLKNAIQTEKVSHSYIFTGDPGSGKKLLAGTYAMTLQCEEGGTEPCGLSLIHIYQCICNPDLSCFGGWTVGISQHRRPVG